MDSAIAGEGLECRVLGFQGFRILGFRVWGFKV